MLNRGHKLRHNALDTFFETGLVSFNALFTETVTIFYQNFHCNYWLRFAKNSCKKVRVH